MNVMKRQATISQVSSSAVCCLQRILLYRTSTAASHLTATCDDTMPVTQEIVRQTRRDTNASWKEMKPVSQQLGAIQCSTMWWIVQKLRPKCCVHWCVSSDTVLDSTAHFPFPLVVQTQIWLNEINMLLSSMKWRMFGSAKPLPPPQVNIRSLQFRLRNFSSQWGCTLEQSSEHVTVLTPPSSVTGFTGNENKVN